MQSSRGKYDAERGGSAAVVRLRTRRMAGRVRIDALPPRLLPPDGLQRVPALRLDGRRDDAARRMDRGGSACRVRGTRGGPAEGAVFGAQSFIVVAATPGYAFPVDFTDIQDIQE